MKRGVDKQKEKILQATHACVGDLGLARLRTKNIAKAAGVSEGIIFYYFPTKDLLLSEVLDWIIKKYVTEVQRALESKPSPLQRIEEIMEYEKRLITREKKRMEVWYDFWVQSLKDPKLRRRMAEAFAAYRGFLQNLVHDGVESGLFHKKDEALLAAVLTSTLEGAAVQLILDPKAFNMNAYFEIVKSMFLRSAGGA